jgi:BirA family biotin operon repressor/biotin-[acetyl-CoA-carboxylase] ligase
VVAEREILASHRRTVPMNDTRRAVLAALGDGPVTGPALAGELGISRAAVWKHVEALREAGFAVEGGDGGYRITDVPAYNGPALEYGLDAPFDVEFHDEIGSTNDRARERADGGATDVAVVAARQTGGRGRLEREWSSPPGGVYVSLLVRPELPPSHAPLLTLAAAVATTRAAREAGVDAGIKWPNDVLVSGANEGDERKLAGILTEMEGEADRVSWVVVGVGANVEVAAEHLPEGATSVAAAGGTADRRAFCQRVLEEFHDLREDPDAVLPAWREHALTLGRRVRVETPGGTVVGEAADVEPPGRLVVETADGKERVDAGDCEHLRPAGE